MRFEEAHGASLPRNVRAEKINKELHGYANDGAPIHQSGCKFGFVLIS